MKRVLVLLGSIACGSEAPVEPEATIPEQPPPASAPLPHGEPSVDDAIPSAGSIEPMHAFTEIIDGRLALHSDRPAICAGCEDLDEDGLSDAWEAVVIDAFRPLVRVAEGDPYLSDPNAKLLQIARLFPVSFDPLIVRALIAIAWSEDYGSLCGGISGHAGDPERVALELEMLSSDRPNDLIVARAYTAAHENTISDASHLFPRDALDQLEHTSEPRWAIYASLQKHASYANLDLCEGASNLPCIRETCGSHAEVLPAAINAGEPEHPLVDDLAPHGFAGDFVWTDSDFCGGLTRGSCAGPLSRKLLDDPF